MHVHVIPNSPLRKSLGHQPVYLCTGGYIPVYSQTCLEITLKGTPNLYFFSEVLAISTGTYVISQSTMQVAL